MEMQYIVPLLAFFVVILLFSGVYAVTRSKKEQVQSRLQKYTRSSGTEEKKEQEQTSDPQGGRLRKPFQSASRAMAPRGWMKKAELELAQADIPLKPEEYVMLNILLVCASIFLAFALTESLIAVLVLALASALVPPMLVKRSRARRTARFNNQLGEGLVIMANSLRAGFSFLQAVDTLSKEMPPPLSTEFARLLKEMNLGTPTEEALTRLMERVDSEDLDLVVTAVKIQRQIGGNLAEVLDKIGHTIQERIRFQGNLKTLTAQGRISGLIISLLPVFILAFVMTVNPSYMSPLFSSPAGIVMLGLAVCSQVIGLLLIRKIVNIEY